MSAKYIYLFEDGTYGVSETAPLSQDNEGIENGTLTVLKCDIEPDGAHGEHVRIKVSELTEDGDEREANVASQESDEHGEYHYLGERR